MNPQANLPAGFTNNISVNPQIPRQVPQIRPPQVNLQSVPPEVLNSIRSQLLEQMHDGGNGPVAEVPVLNNDDSYSLLGFALQKKYVYIILFLLLLVVGYYVWKWYTKPSKNDDLDEDDEDDEDEDDEDLPFDGMAGYPSAENKQLMQQQLMQQQLMQQQLMQQQRKMAEQQKNAKDDKGDEE